MSGAENSRCYDLSHEDIASEGEAKNDNDKSLIFRSSGCSVRMHHTCMHWHFSRGHGREARAKAAPASTAGDVLAPELN